MWWVAVTSVLASAPEEGRYLMLVDGGPVGLVHFRRDGARYDYTSTHVYRSAKRTQSFTLAFDEATPPEVWWLSRRRPDGCRTVREERKGQDEQVCLRGNGGTIDGQRFDARYRASGELEVLTVGGVRFEASDAKLPDRADPFADGFAVHGDTGQPRLEPSVAGARAVHVAGLTVDAAPEASCLDIARREASKGGSVVLGLVLDGGRAWPHAWLRRADGTLRDPTVATGAPNRRWYLELPQHAGRTYLELLAGHRRVVLTP